MAQRSVSGCGAGTPVREGYNIAVPTASKRSRSQEATGLAIVAALVLIIIVIRYWHQIPWSAR
jgi:hypothetical protein